MRIDIKWAQAALVVLTMVVAPLAKADGTSSMATAGGAGVFAASNAGVDDATGSAVVTYPFILPAPRGKARVELGLAYRSDRGDAEAGKGWGLTLPSIERHRSSTLPPLNQPPGSYLPRPRFPSAADEFTWNGEPLVEICTIQNGSCAYGTDQSFRSAVNGWKYYRLRREGENSFIRFFHSEDWNPQHSQVVDSGWQVEYKDGVIETYGDDAASVDWLPTSRQRDRVGETYSFAERPVAVRWNLSTRFDSHEDAGVPLNKVSYVWTRPHAFGRSVLSDIWYTPHATNRTVLNQSAHHVRLVWQDHEFRFPHLAPVDKIAPDVRLIRVDVTSRGDTSAGAQNRTLIRRYRLLYHAYEGGPQRNHSFLKSIEMEGASGATEGSDSDSTVPEGTQGSRLPPTSFEYTRLSKLTTGAVAYLESSDRINGSNLWSDPWRSSIVDLDRDGLPDFVTNVEQSDGWHPQAWIQTGQISTPGGIGYALREECAQVPILTGANLFADTSLTLQGQWGASNPNGFVWADVPPGVFYSVAYHETRAKKEPPQHSLCPPALVTGAARNGWNFQDVGASFQIGDPNFQPTTICPNSLPNVGLLPCSFFRHPLDANSDGAVDLYAQFSQQNPSDSTWPVLINDANQQMLFSYQTSGTVARMSERVRTNVSLRRRRGMATFADINGDGVPDFVLGRLPRNDQGHVSISSVAYVPGFGDGSFETKGRFSTFSPQADMALLDTEIAYDVPYCDPNAIGGCPANNTTPGVANVRAILLDSSPQNHGWSELPYDPNAPDPDNRRWAEDRYPLFADLNGDGLADAVVPMAVKGAGDVTTVTLAIWINLDGRTFRRYCQGEPAQCPDDAGPSIQLQAGHHRFRVGFADMDASGTTDIVVIKEDQQPAWWGFQGPWATDSAKEVQRRVPGGLLRSVDNGVGYHTEYTYATIQNLENKAQWTHQAQVVQPVVTDIHTYQTQPTSISSTMHYTYTDPAYDPWTQRLVGFSSVTALDQQRQRYTQTKYFISPCSFDTASNPGGCAETTSEDDFLQAVTGRPLEVGTWTLVNGNKVELGRTTYSYENRPIFPTTAGGRRVWFAYPRQIDHQIPYQAGGASYTVVQTAVTTNGEGPPTTVDVVVTYSEPGELVRWSKYVDSFGNTTRSTAHGRITQQGGAWDEPIVTDSVWERDSGQRPWAFNIVEKTISNGGGTPERVTRTTYAPSSRDITLVEMRLDGSGALNRVHAAGGPVAPPPPGAAVDGWKQLGHFEYDVFGNIKRAFGPSRPTTAGNVPSCVDYAYDADYANFPVQTSAYRGGCGVDPLNMNSTYDRGFGHVVTTMNAALEMSYFEHDGFGRLTAAHGPDHILPVMWDPQAQVQQVYSDSGYVRQVETQTHIGGGVFRRSIEEVNSRGDVIAQWDQADPTKDGFPWIVRVPVRDSIGRLIGEHRPVGTNMSPASKQGYSMGPVPAPAAQRVYVLDAFDRVQTVREAGQDVFRREYAGLTTRDYREGHLTAVPYGASPVINSVNGHGRLIYSAETVNPNSSEIRTVTRTYSATGALLSQSENHASGQNAHDFFYDSFGRVVLSVDWNAGDGTRHWGFQYNDAGELVGTSDPRGCGANYHYDGLGRIVAKDLSPCTAAQATYSVPDLNTGDGTEAFYQYDNPEPGEPSSHYGELTRLAGKLVSVRDRASHTRYGYDLLSRQQSVHRRVAKPGVPSDSLASRYTNHWFDSEVEFDAANRPIAVSTGADIPELQPSGGGTSQFTYTYGIRGAIDEVGSSYGTLWAVDLRSPEGLMSQFHYGDLAHTTGTFAYDARFRTTGRTLTRAAPALWNQSNHPYYVKPPTGATYRQTVLADDAYTYDSASNPSKIEDKRLTSEWNTGYKPATRSYTYDFLFRVIGTSTGYGTGGVSNDTYKNPYAPEQTAGDDRPAPRRNATNRARTQTYTYDWRDNITSSTDDASLFWDRSTATSSLGNGQGWQLDRLNSIGSGNNEATIIYDEQGNMSEVRVKRTGTCPVGGCFQAYGYSWDEDGRLARARRWDSTTLAGLNTSNAPAWDVAYAYDSRGQRVIKSSSDDAGNTSHTLEVLPTLRLNRTTYTAGTNDYVRNAATETLYLGGLARVISAPNLPRTSNSNQHVYIGMGDHLGSTSTVIDKDTSEVVEASLHDTYGRLESDYRPARWQSFREDYKFTGKEEDAEIGLVYFGARYYSPNFGRFISPDPLTILGAMAGPNPYAYVGGRATTTVDPWGLSPKNTGVTDADPTSGHGKSGGPSGPYDFDADTITGSRPTSQASGHAPIEAMEPKIAQSADRHADRFALGNESFGISLPRQQATDFNYYTFTSGALVWTINGAQFRADRVNAYIARGLVSEIAGDGVASGELGEVLIHEGTDSGPVGVPAGEKDKDRSADVARGAVIGMTILTGVAAEKLAKSGIVAAVKGAPLAYSVAFETRLAEGELGLSRARHFAIANEALAKARAAVPELAELVPAPSGRVAPAGWVWQHATVEQGAGRTGVMQLVPKAQHTPGSPFWRLLHPLPNGGGGYAEWAIPAGAPRN